MNTVDESILSPTLVEACRALGAATIYDASGRVGGMNSSIRPLRPGIGVAGRAFTCRCQPGDNLTLYTALKLARKGDVIVCDGGGVIEPGLLGDVMASWAIAGGVAGLVVDGSVRDAVSIRRLGFAVFSRGTSLKAPCKRAFGSVGEPVSVGGVVVCTGDLIVGDDDGVVAVPRQLCAGILEQADRLVAKEDAMRQAIAAGGSLWDMLGMDALSETKAPPSPEDGK